jgi:hypothetical protein
MGVKMDSKKLEREGVEWVNLNKEKDQQRVFENTVINFRTA